MVREMAALAVGVLFGFMAGCVVGWVIGGTAESWPYFGAVAGFGAVTGFLILVDVLRVLRNTLFPVPRPDDARPVHPNVHP